jgi:hypothetical protein
MLKPPQKASRMVAPSRGLKKPSNQSEKSVSKIGMGKKVFAFNEDDCDDSDNKDKIPGNLLCHNSYRI